MWHFHVNMRRINTQCNFRQTLIYLQIWGFENERADIYQTINLYRQVHSISLLRNNALLFGFMSGETDIMHWDESEQKLYRIGT